jgi:hypothetical protein
MRLALGPQVDSLGLGTSGTFDGRQTRPSPCLPVTVPGPYCAGPHSPLRLVRPTLRYTSWMGCYFCFAEGDRSRLSKEHLLSKPVAEAFGLDRSAAFGQLRGTDDPVILAQLDDLAVRFACERCNNTWMNALEHEMAALAAWADPPDQSLTPAQFEILRAWSLKTYLVLSAMVGETRRFAKNPRLPGVIPNLTRARQLREKDARAFDGIGLGLARPHEPSRFAYAFGNPTVIPQGPRYASRKSAGLAIVTLGALQIWVVDPTIFHAAQISFPMRVRILEPGLKYGALRGMPVVPRLEDVVVNNGEHDIVELVDRLNAWARARSTGQLSE